MTIDLERYVQLQKRIRLLGEQMRLHRHNEDEFWLYAAEIDKATAELGRLTGADQDPDWPK